MEINHISLEDEQPDWAALSVMINAQAHGWWFIYDGIKYVKQKNGMFREEALNANIFAQSEN